MPKHDSKKVDLSMLLSLGPELEEIAKLLQFGAQKYSKDNWRCIDDGKRRYTAAMLRHLFAEEKELYDLESKALHATAVACNALFRLHFILQEIQDANNNEATSSASE